MAIFGKKVRKSEHTSEGKSTGSEPSLQGLGGMAYVEAAKDALRKSQGQADVGASPCIMCARWIPGDWGDNVPDKMWYIGADLNSGSCAVVCPDCQCSGVVGMDYITGEYVFAGDAQDPVPQLHDKDTVNLMLDPIVCCGVQDRLLAMGHGIGGQYAREDN